MEEIKRPKFEIAPNSIIPVEISQEVKKAFLEYSMSVIVSRALPDVRDGLKPVHRRILYTMFERGLTPDKAHRKCADTVGAVLGSYHPHGDSSVYDAMVRLAQDFSLRYMLVDGHGNFGSIDGYKAAAYRYTESRMSKMAMYMLQDIDKETVDYMPNYDDRLKEPVVLPSRFPNLLVNGSSGIAVGMATNIPPHNLGEVIDAMCCLIDNPEAELDELCQYIKGPDFPTGGIIMGRSGIRAAYATGRGKIILRAKTEIEEVRNGKFRIIVTEIPYMITKLSIVKNINDLINDKAIEGLEDVVDYSGRDGIKIVIEVKKDYNPQVVLNHLFQRTQLQSTFGAILLALVNGIPKILTLKQMLQEYIDYQCDVITRRTVFELKKAQERAHILEGLKIALDYIDEVIKIIRASKSVNDSKAALSERFNLDDVQTTAIVQMPLGRLSGMEREKIEDELNEKHIKIAEYEAILADHTKILDIVKTEALNIRDKFNDERRTEITTVSGDVDIEDLIPLEQCILTKTANGYIKRLAADTYSVQHRGGNGVIGMTTRDDDIVENMFTCSSHDYVMLFTNLGRVYRMKAYEIPEGTRTSKGMNMINLVPLMPGEKITVIVPTDDIDSEKYVCMGTKRGIIKRTAMKDFVNTRKTGVIALSMEENDELAFVKITDGSGEFMVATKNGKIIRFPEGDVRCMGRTARGVRSIRLADGDEVIGMEICPTDGELLTISETGFGRRSPVSDYRIQSRGGKGIINYHCEKYGKVAAVIRADDNDDVIIIRSNGSIIRTPFTEISTFARPSKGVKVMRIDDDDKILSVISAPHDDALVDEDLDIDESGVENPPVADNTESDVTE